MEKLRIGMVTLCYRPTINGVVRMIDLYKTEYEAGGHDVTIFTLGAGNESSDGVVTSYGLPIGQTGYFVNGFLNQAAAQQMAQMDILHCHHLFLTMSLARRYGRCPIVYTNHTRYDLYAEFISNLPKPFIEAVMGWYWPKACQQADVVIAPSASLRQVLTQFNVAEPIETIENGVDKRPFFSQPTPLSKASLGIPEAATLLIYVGRLSKEKNLGELLIQFQKVQAHCPNVFLLLVGDGPERSRLQKWCHLEKIEHCVRFEGQILPQQVPAYLVTADLFVTASKSEVHPLTLIEAAMAGLPIVAPVAPGNREIVRHGVSGLLVADGDSLAERLIELIQHPKKRALNA